MLNLPEVEKKPADIVVVKNPEPAVTAKETLETTEPPIRKKRPRKAIVKHLKFDKLTEASAENPALRAIITEPAEEKAFICAPKEAKAKRQIVSIPLLLINEQLGAAVERFNVCACDDCLRGITDSALAALPPLYVRVINIADENEVNRLIKEHRAEVIRVLAKICITALTKPFHDK